MTKIAEFYKSAKLYDPPFIEYREFGFIKNNKFTRHKTFLHIFDVKNYCIKNEPDGVFFSATYYKHPSITPMDEKNKHRLWQDLIFDIDFTDLPSRTILESEYHARHIINYCQKVLGAKDILFVFSGRKGHHVRVRDQEIIKMTQEQRVNLTEILSDIPFDTTVTKDPSRLIRLPGSLYVSDDFTGICSILPTPTIDSFTHCKITKEPEPPTLDRLLIL